MKYVLPVIATVVGALGAVWADPPTHQVTRDLPPDLPTEAQTSFSLEGVNSSAKSEAAMLAVADAQKRVREARSAFGKKSREHVVALTALGDAYFRVKELDKTWATYYSAVQKAKKLASESALVGQLYLKLGRTAVRQKNYSAAHKQLKRSARAFEGLDDQTLGLASVYFWQGKAFYASGRESRAIDALSNALRLYEKSDELKMQIHCHGHILRAYSRLGKLAKATEHNLLIGKLAEQLGTPILQPIFTRKPKYPFHQHQLGRQGEVVVELTVDEKGFVVDPKVVDLQGPDSFAEAALEAVEEFRYVPRFVNGIPVKTTNVRYQFSFGLDAKL